MIQIDLFSDVICPWCYIGKRRMERALKSREELSVEINWRAFQLNPEMPSTGIPREQYLILKFGDKTRAKAIYDNIQKAGDTEGLSFNFDNITHTPNTVLAHRLIGWSQKQNKSEDIVENLFKAYFVDGRNIGSMEILREIAIDTNLDANSFDEHFSNDDDLQEIHLETRYAYENGITGVPCFIFNKSFSITGAQEPEAFLPLLDIKPDP